MQANNLYERRFRHWVLAQVQAQGHIYYDEAVNSGAEFTGCQIITAAKYLKKLTSTLGPLTESTDMLGRTAIVLKPNLDTDPPATTNGANLAAELPDRTSDELIHYTPKHPR